MVLALRQSGTLVGLAPFLIFAEATGSERKLLLLGTGLSDYVDALFDPEWESWCARTVFAYLNEQRHRWDFSDLHQLPAKSSLLRAALPEDWTGEAAAGEVCPLLKLPGAVEELPRFVPSRQLQRLNDYRERLARRGSARMEITSRENFDELFEALLRLHRVRWSAKGGPGVLVDPTVQQFHREAALGLLARGTLRFYGLRLDGRIVAVLYGFLGASRRGYYYLSGFDPRLKRLSLGTIMIGHAIEQAVAEGGTEFDFLRGQEAYKYQWGATDRPTFRRWFRPGGANHPFQFFAIFTSRAPETLRRPSQKPLAGP